MPTAQILAVALVTFYAVFTDLKFNKIPNMLVLSGLVGGFFLQQLSLGGVNGFLNWFVGMLTGGLFLLPFYVMGGMAAGDIKLMAAVGGIVGWPVSMMAVGLTLVSGFFLALAYCAVRGGLKELLMRFAFAIKMLIQTGRPYFPEAEENSVAQSRFPYAIAIAAGGIWSSLV